MKTVQQEKAAIKKLENVKKDHETRIKSLQEVQALDRRKAELIEMNSELVNNGIKVINSAIANQIPWDQIKEIIKEATENRDPVASRIKEVKFDVNHIVMLLSDPYQHLNQDYYEDNDGEDIDEEAPELLIEVDLSLSAQANARKYFVQKKFAAVKEKKTVESGGVALKSAEKKTKQQLKEMSKIATINKARKVFWFEKFFWFISSENYLVIGGKDAQQNELLVKRYMKANDVYVHADLHGAATVVVKNPRTELVPPKTLTEAGQFAVCFSAAWDSKVITAAYWVKPDQVSKTAPSGEYLTVGSFMIRGKKNFLPPATLIMGFGFLFKLEESSIERHKGERKIRGVEDPADVTAESVAEGLEEIEINVEEGDSEDEEEEKKQSEEEEKLETIAEKVTDTEEKDDEEMEQGEAEEEEVADEIKEVDDGTNEEVDADEEDTNLTEFPDTDVKVGLDRLGSVEIKVKTEADEKQSELGERQGQRKGKKKGGQGQREQKQKTEVTDQGKKSENVRGKKGKMKKIKEKYKDQDDEERELRMQLLQSQGREKANKNKNSKKGLEQLYGKSKTKEKRPPPKPRNETEGAVGPDEEKVAVNDETDMVDSLTGLPVDEDELLFVVPVCAPYSTLNNYKFKVKLTPGKRKYFLFKRL